MVAGGQHFDPLRTGELFKKGNDYAESIDMMFDVVQGGALSLGTTNGSVKINTWSRDQIRVVITKTTRAGSPYNDVSDVSPTAGSGRTRTVVPTPCWGGHT